VFVPRREHAQFCSRACRLAWNRNELREVAVGPSVLDWTLSAMREATERLARLRAWNRTRAFEAISDAVWRVTMLDAALVRYHPKVYDDTLDRLGSADQVMTEETLAGLRLVRNRIGESDDVQQFVDPGTTDWDQFVVGQLADWRWKTVPAPSSGSQSESAQAWEQSRYRAYQTRVAGTALGDTFARCTVFLQAAAGGAMRATRTNTPLAH
jgi:hypothetical protein